MKEIRQEEVWDNRIYIAMTRAVNQYSLKKEPESNHLIEFLDAYTKDKLLNLADDNGLKAKKSWNKGRIIEVLEDNILATLIDRLMILGKTKLKLLQKMVNDGFDENNTTYEEVEYYEEVFLVAVRLGLVFPLDDGDSITTYTPIESIEELEKVLKSYSEFQAKYQEKINLWNEIEDYLHTAIHLYGVVSREEVEMIWEIQSPFGEKVTANPLQRLFYLQEYLPWIVIRNHYLNVSNLLFASTSFKNAEEIKEFYYNRSNELENHFYQPTKNDIQYYSKYSFDSRTLAYKKLKRHVIKNVKKEEVDFIMGTIEISIQKGTDLQSIINYFAHYGVWEFHSQKQLEDFADLYFELHNNSRLWELGGFTPIEMIEQFENDRVLGEFEASVVSSRETRPKKQKEKVGRNDPCPCDSGKKYKKCCMKKDAYR